MCFVELWLVGRICVLLLIVTLPVYGFRVVREKRQSFPFRPLSGPELIQGKSERHCLSTVTVYLTRSIGPARVWPLPWSPTPLGGLLLQFCSPCTQ
jgi:hypothetical protein